MKTVHIMVDIETMGKTIGAPIWAIGACVFDPNDARHVVDDSFYTIVDLTDQEYTRKFDGSTVAFWMRPDLAEAREEYHKASNRVNLPGALVGFADWVLHAVDLNTLAIWGNGSMFDNAILLDAYKSNGLSPPPAWRYRSDRCFRTMKEIAGNPDPVQHGVAHRAIDDAIAQAFWLKDIVARHGLTL